MTNNEKKYYLYKFLMRDILTSNNYLQNFIVNFLSDSSIIITDEEFEQIKIKLHELRATIPDNGWGRSSVVITSLITNSSYTDFQNKFNEIMQILGVTYTGTSAITYTLPNNNTKVQSNSALRDEHIILKPHQEYFYAKKTYPYYSLENLEPMDITNVHYDSSKSTYWHYDSEKNAIIIEGTGKTGTGIYESQFTPYEETANCNTVVFERGITEITSVRPASETANTGTTTPFNTVVFKHLTTDDLTVRSGAFLAPKSASNPKFKYIIYADHPAVRNYSFSSNIDVEWHTVSEWEALQNGNS